MENTWKKLCISKEKKESLAWCLYEKKNDW